MNIDILDTVQHNREKLKLAIYFVVMGVLAGPLALFLGEAWRQAHLTRTLIYALDPHLSITLEMFSTFWLGVFLGLLVLVTLDPKKRWQGVLLWIGLGTGLLGLQSMGLFLPNIDLIDSAPFVLVGMLVGAVGGGGRKLGRLQTAEPLEFRRAATAIFYLLTVIILVALLEFHIDYTDIFRVTSEGIQIVQPSSFSVSLNAQSIFLNVFVGSVFIVTLRRFMEYDAEQKFFVLGPPASGKSLFLIGAYLEALEDVSGRNATTPMSPSNDLMDMVEKLDMKNSDWIVEATAPGEVKDLHFRYIHGRLFPRNVEIYSLDYAGEYLSRLPDALTGLLEQEEDQVLRTLARNVQDADTLILLIDVARFINNEPLDISEYFSVLQAVDNTDVMLVATKCDIMADRFEEERGVEAHRYYDDFKEFVNTRLQNNQQIQALLEETGGTDIHPVYYQTKLTEQGDGRVPMRDADGSITTVGFDRLLDKLGR